jgi:predicted O-methyltransferase YrrM
MASASRPGGAAPAERLQGVLGRLLRDGTLVARSDGSAHRLFPVAVGPAEGEALRERVVREGALATIEVGLGYGIAALYVCAGLLERGDGAARHVAIDPYQATRFAGCGLQVLDEAGVGELVEHHGEESQIVLPRLLGEGRRFDLAFVDGNHRFDGVFLDLVYLGRLLRPGGVLFVDDHQLPAVARAVSYCVADLGWTLEEASTADELHHWVVLRTSRTPDTRPYDHFVEF